MILFFCVVIFSSALIWIIISRFITKPMGHIIKGMNEGADRVAITSGQVSAASHSLAQGSSEQAASIEETSSSLEEMSSMTRQNAENAMQADNLMKETNQVVKKANADMSNLTSSMEEISVASQETSKIVKTIDEIAFQTNLLALNAAVEAARAGEAGAGFAVVADEVRNLALRSAEAAKNTADLIESTVKKIGGGVELVTTASDAFSEVATSAAKVGSLVGEIAAASSEQAQGIEQVNIAVNEMDKITQQTAASAEESASASEVMNAQAEQMKELVTEMVSIVGGSKDRSNSVSSAATQETQPIEGFTATQKIEPPANLIVTKPQEIKPEQIIPLDDYEDF
jgi:methyl-accepting chemotaxis protein